MTEMIDDVTLDDVTVILICSKIREVRQNTGIKMDVSNLWSIVKHGHVTVHEI